jgi:hypothetical protein
MKPTEYTEEEVRDQFLNYIREMVDEWDAANNKTTKEKLNGLAFTILAAIDGNSPDVPSFILAPFPHEDDKQYKIDNGENYYPDNNGIDVKCDIAGDLHEKFYK